MPLSGEKSILSVYEMTKEIAEAGAIPVTVGVAVLGSTLGAPDPEPPAAYCNTSVGEHGLWHLVVGDGTTYTASLCGSAYDTKILVYCEECSDLDCGIGNDDACGLQSEVTFGTIEGAEYIVLVNGWGTSAGSWPPRERWSPSP